MFHPEHGTWLQANPPGQPPASVALGLPESGTPSRDR